jgi:FkbM family methyltransferase
VGANIGVYSLYAAAKHEGVRVFAFEPESLNYAALNQNIALNGFQNAIRAYCLALSESAALSDLAIAKMRAGGSNNQFGDHGSAPSHIQGALGLSLDDLCSRWALPIPHTLKIDVDGLELPILRGAEQILSHPQFRSLLIELRKDDPAQADAVKAICERAGLVMVAQSHRKKTADPMVVFEKR